MAGTILVYCACEQLDNDVAINSPFDDVPLFLSDEPTLRIGSADGPLGYLFRRIGSVMVARDSVIVVVDRGANVIRTYDLAGSHIQSFGRVGGGPEEFLALWDAWLSADGDTIIAWDVLGHRVSEWSVSSGFIRARRLPIDFQPVPLGRLSDGMFLVVQKEERLPVDPGDVVENQGIVYRMSLDSGDPSELLRITWEAVAAGIDSRDGVGTLFVGQPFRASASAVIADDVFYVTDGTRYLVHKYDRAGVLQDSLTLPDLPPAISEDERIAWIDHSVSLTQRNLRAGVRRFLNSLTIPDRYPAFTELLIDDAGYLWSRLGVIGVDSASVWAVFDSIGDHVAMTSMPRRFTPSVIGRETVVGKQVSDLDVESVVVLPVLRDPRVERNQLEPP